MIIRINWKIHLVNIILLKKNVHPKELYRLLTEFPQYQLVRESEQVLSPEQMHHVEIIYSESLTTQELQQFPHLRWLHVPSPNIEGICIEEIEKRENILVTRTKEENITPIGEYATGLLLAFTKNLFLLRENKHRTEEIISTMWTAENRSFLQIGLGSIGTEVSKRARQLGFQVWGMQDPPSFHPYCSKVLSEKDLHSVLPAVDVVCLALPRDQSHPNWFTGKELKLMKEEAIFLAFGSGNTIDLQDLAQAASEGKFRGIGIDAYFEKPILANSPLWTLPQVLITPEVSSYPHQDREQTFNVFLYNLRSFLHGNFSDMTHLVNESALYSMRPQELD